MAKSLHTPEYDRFRNLLIKAREARALTQSEVASRLNKPQSFVAKYERGERRLDVVELVEVCGALEIDPHTVLAALAEGKAA